MAYNLCRQWRTSPVRLLCPRTFDFHLWPFAACCTHSFPVSWCSLPFLSQKKSNDNTKQAIRSKIYFFLTCCSHTNLIFIHAHACHPGAATVKSILLFIFLAQSCKADVNNKWGCRGKKKKNQWQGCVLYAWRCIDEFSAHHRCSIIFTSFVPIVPNWGGVVRSHVNDIKSIPVTLYECINSLIHSGFYMIARQSVSLCFLQALKLVVQYFGVYLNSVSDGSI